MEKTILNLLNKYNGNWDDVYNAVSQKEDINHYKLNFNLPNDLNSYFIAYKDYPNKFKNISMPPFFVFWYGNIDLLNNCVLGFTSALLNEDYQLLLLNSQSLNKYTLCFKENCIDKIKISNLISKGYSIILVANGGINTNSISEITTKKILIISEFWDFNRYKPSDGQTIERIIFAVSNTIYLTTNLNSIESLIFNYKKHKKTIFCHENIQEFVKKINKNNLKISYVKNIHDIV